MLGQIPGQGDESLASPEAPGAGVHPGHGIGLLNVHERIRLGFGTGGISADGRVDGLTTFSVHLPLAE
jgi:sensor histidine kinase YesM